MLKRLELSVLLGMIVAVILSGIGAFAGEIAEIRGQVFRLHLLAHADSQPDEALKLAVRDAILTRRPEILGGGATKEEARQLALKHLSEIERIAQSEIHRLGYSYPVSAEIVNMYFATRRYEGFILPAGRYDAVRLIIGEGGGNNWWCIMFPPMCIPAARPGDSSLEEQIAHFGQAARYKPKFAVVELIESLRAEQ